MPSSRFLIVGLFLVACSGIARSEQVTADDLRWLDRITYGANAENVERLEAVGREVFLAEQLAPAGSALPDPVAEKIKQLTRLQRPLQGVLLERQRAGKAVKAIESDADARRKARKLLGMEDAAVVGEAQQRLLLRAVYSRAQLQEQMAWFWFNHFNVYSGKQEIGYMLADYEDSLRPHLLGNFRDLLRASLTQPAMLHYLDNSRSKKGKLNENYARELMELHTLGVDGGYTQKDVQELARILTGLATVPLAEQKPRNVVDDKRYRRFGLVEFNPRQHDFGDKKLLGKPITAKGWQEIEDVIDILVRHPSTARYISTRLANYFVSDTPPPDLVERMAARFRDSDGDIRSVLETLFASPEFSASLGTKYKSSWQYVVSVLRVVPGSLALDGATSFAATSLGSTSFGSSQALAALQQLAQVPYEHSTPDGYSLAGKAWSSPGQLATRLEIAKDVSTRAGAGSAFDAAPVDVLLPLLSEEHRALVAAENDPRHRLMLLLSAPEFMYR